jgi:hypothetical protein
MEQAQYQAQVVAKAQAQVEAEAQAQAGCSCHIRPNLDGPWAQLRMFSTTLPAEQGEANL